MKIERPSREALIRYYRGQSLPQEEKLIDLYLSMDIDREYVELCLSEAWNNLEDEPLQLLDGQQRAAWDKFQQKKIGINQFPARHNIRWYAYAASVVLFIICTVVVIHFKSSKPDQLGHEHYSAALGKRREVKLKDNSTVMLFPGSSMDVPADFNSKDRKVTLKGRAFFEVAHNLKKPFLVTTGQLLTKDLGTSFEINEAGTTSMITLKTGSVSINAENKELAKLTPGQKLTYQTNSHKFVIEKLDVNKSISWVNGELSYDLTPLDQICHDMEKWYNVKIMIKTPDLLNKKITTSFKDLPVTKVLDMLSVSSGLTYTINGNQITINQKEDNLAK
jgi:transmembrane sensor